MTESPAGRWTRAEDYLGAFARKRTYRRSMQRGPRTEPESPRLMLSTVPFLALFGLLAVLSVAIMVTAFPGSQPEPQVVQLAQHQELGVARKGWFQEAEKDFHQ